MRFLPIVAAALAATPADAFTALGRTKGVFSTSLNNGPIIGAGGMADTRDPDSFEHEDPISLADRDRSEPGRPVGFHVG